MLDGAVLIGGVSVSVVDCQQTEQNLLGQTVRQTRSGANGSTLETTTAYDTYGRVAQITAAGQPTQTFAYASTGEQTALTQTVGEEWRKQQSEAEYLLRDGDVWRKQTAVQSCSDADIAPLTQTVYTQLSGLSVSNTFNQIIVDIRGNETRIFGNDTQRITQVPSCSNPQIERYAFGQLVETVDTACVTNRFEYDALDRRVAAIDGRNNRTVYAYDAKGNLVSTTDAVGAVTAYGYDVMGQNVAVTNALGNVTVYTYDVRGRLTSTGGVVYPVNYEYDVYGNRTKMTTFRDEEGEGDVTAWTYDAATGAVVSKTYADGRGPTYTLTDLGQVATRTDARGVVTTYTYNLYGDLVSQTYSDGTPAVTYAYDSLGRQTQVTDAAGTTTFTYGQYGELVSESVSGGYAKTLTRHTDAFGRDVGYSIDGVRQRTLTYDTNTGRLSGMDGFVWDYLPGSDLKAKLTYPNGATAEWAYEPKRDLLTQVKNTIHGTLASQYDYTNDLLGRRTAIGKSGSMMEQNETQDYAYNVRDELISGQGRTYAYDDIGNRTAAEERGYVANALNQYTAIDDFAPEYDLDGNQTKVQTETGVWAVTYNAENRPIRWEQGETCVQRLDATQGNAVRTEFVWDPTEPVATRPLAMRAKNWGLNLFYTHDGNKNVSEVFYHALQNGIAAHYDYAPFGAVTRTARATRVTNRDILSENPFRFSSEYHDFTLDLGYYNYRYYNSMYGRWENRDPFGSINLFLFCLNSPEYNYDWLGLEVIFYGGDVLKAIEYLLNNAKAVTGENALALPIPKVEVISQTIDAVCDENCHPEGIRYIATVTIKPKSDVSPASVVMPKWKSSSASEAERELFRQVYKLVLEHEQEHVRIWNKYMNKLFVEYTDAYESCSKHGILDLAKSNAKEKLTTAYRHLSAQFTKENNDFQKRDETTGRHQRVNALINEYKQKRSN